LLEKCAKNQQETRNQIKKQETRNQIKKQETRNQIKKQETKIYSTIKKK
jgi:hypothetical protein